MSKSLAILIGTLCAASTLQAAPSTPQSSTTKNESPPPLAEQFQVVKTAKWGFEAPNLFPLDPQEVNSQGAATRPGPRNQLRTPPHGGLVGVVDWSREPGRE